MSKIKKDNTSDTRSTKQHRKPKTEKHEPHLKLECTTNGADRWSSVIQIFRNGQTSHDGDRKTFEVTDDFKRKS